MVGAEMFGYTREGEDGGTTMKNLTERIIGSLKKGKNWDNRIVKWDLAQGNVYYGGFRVPEEHTRARESYIAVKVSEKAFPDKYRIPGDPEVEEQFGIILQEKYNGYTIEHYFGEDPVDGEWLGDALQHKVTVSTHSACGAIEEASVQVTSMSRTTPRGSIDQLAYRSLCQQTLDKVGG